MLAAPRQRRGAYYTKSPPDAFPCARGKYANYDPLHLKSFMV